MAYILEIRILFQLYIDGVEIDGRLGDAADVDDGVVGVFIEVPQKGQV